MPALRYLLDTNTVRAVMRGHAGVDARLFELDPATWAISAITHSEIRYGLALRPQGVRLSRVAEAFFAVAATLPWDVAAAESHGRLRAALRQAGTPIGDLDEMIGAHALALGVCLVTDNTRHFQRVEGLALENWVFRKAL